MQTFYVTANRQRQVERFLSFKAEANTIKFDYSPWAEDNGTVTSVTVVVENGQAAVSGEALASNVKTMVVTTSEVGGSMISLSATDGTDIHKTYLYIYTKDPDALTSDYGITA